MLEIPRRRLAPFSAAIFCPHLHRWRWASSGPVPPCRDSTEPRSPPRLRADQLRHHRRAAGPGSAPCAPRLQALLALIVLEAVDPGGHRPRAPRWPQAHVHLIQRANALVGALIAAIRALCETASHIATGDSAFGPSDSRRIQARGRRSRSGPHRTSRSARGCRVYPWPSTAERPALQLIRAPTASRRVTASNKRRAITASATSEKECLPAASAGKLARQDPRPDEHRLLLGENAGAVQHVLEIARLGQAPSTKHRRASSSRPGLARQKLAAVDHGIEQLRAARTSVSASRGALDRMRASSVSRPGRAVQQREDLHPGGQAA
jgi:hypothetical protein